MATPSRMGNPGVRNPLDDPWIRFQVELEFVQSLGNPEYLTYLAQQGHFEKPEFINYLEYLQYFKLPGYSKFVNYPFCLHMLELLQYEEFRRDIAKEAVRRKVDEQIILHWTHYIKRRTDLINKHVQNFDAMTNSSVAGSHG